VIVHSSVIEGHNHNKGVSNLSNKRAKTKTTHQQSAANTINFDSYARRTPTLTPKSLKQEEYINLLQSSEKLVIFAVGPAGTGKTLLAVSAGIQALRKGLVKKMVITRPAVGVDDENHGFLPGDINMKMEPWVKPIFDVILDYYSKRDLIKMLEEETIELSPLAYMRGRSFSNCWIIADEMQNASPNQVKMLLTRIGQNTKLIVTGDTRQTDKAGDENGLLDFQKISNNFKNHRFIDGVEFTGKDIQRHAVVSEVLKIYGDI
jgi:phosphate starvation-inducible PhoH-like protein